MSQKRIAKIAISVLQDGVADAAPGLEMAMLSGVVQFHHPCRARRARIRAAAASSASAVTRATGSLRRTSRYRSRSASLSEGSAMRRERLEAVRIHGVRDCRLVGSETSIESR